MCTIIILSELNRIKIRIKLSVRPSKAKTLAFKWMKLWVFGCCSGSCCYSSSACAEDPDMTRDYEDYLSGVD